MPNSRACRTSSSRPVWRGSSPASCSATPIRRRAASGSRRDVDAGDARACPTVIDSSVVSIRTVVDLPAPFGPEEAEDLAGLDPQVDAAHGLDRAARLV